MNTYAERAQKDKGRTVANEVSQKRSDGESTFQLVDNRYEAAIQRQMQEMADDSHQSTQLKAYQDLMNKGVQVNQSSTYEKIGGGTKTIQRMVVYSGANPPEDSNVIATLPDTERSVGTPIVHEDSDPDYGSHNKIALLSHGNQGSIDWKGGSWSGKKLVDDELLAQGREIKAGSLLELWPCSAGVRSSEASYDSLVDAVRDELSSKSVTGVTVRGVKGSHLVLNDIGDHYIPKYSVSEAVVLDVFPKLRSYYLWLWGFFSNEIVTKKLNGFVQKTVGTTDGTHPVLYPKNEQQTEVYIKNIRTLYNAEKACGGIDPLLTYEAFLKQRMASWSKMCSFLRTNDAFKAITQKVDADWFELDS